ncbi:MAG TPA: glycoside hydrolase family 3 N-terminal domain-containing protein [Thermoanaerobaculia bacterium]|nr:glycoside hydrolase family 3 N-terminal domain-containing protein [Thermoanaerobaculia bacterium]
MKRAIVLIAFALLISVHLEAGDDSRARERWVEKTLKSMSLDEKIGQMIIPAGPPPGNFRAIDSDDMLTVRRNITEFHVGGYHTFGGDPAANALMIDEWQRMAKVPLLITADVEGGPAYVMFGATRLPLAMSFGAAGDPQLAYDAGKLTAQECRAIGVNWIFYPVSDVNNNPANPIINIRSYGEDPKAVAKMVTAYIRGAQENGVIATAKHFPGHGDVATDSHLALPVLDVPRERFETLELVPFRAAIAAGVDTIMTTHIYMPQLEPEKGVPATLSKSIITGVLRDELGFKGVVVTDAMTMGGISKYFSPADATLRAVKAGVDVLLFVPSVETSFNTIRAAVQSGEIPQSRIDESVRRILRLKADLDLANPKNRFTDVSGLMEKVGTKPHRELAQTVADDAVTLVRDEQHVLPLKPSPDVRVVQINILDSHNGWREGAVGRVLTAELPKRFPKSVTIQIDPESTSAELDMARKMAQLADVLLVNGYVRVAAFKGSIDLASSELSLLNDLIAMKKPLVYTAFGSPYVLLHIAQLPSYVVTYDITPAAEMAAIRAITGEIPFKGHLPVNLPGMYSIGPGREK